MRAVICLVLVGLGLASGNAQTAATAEHTMAWSFVVKTGDRLTVDAPAGSVHLRYAKGSALVVRLVESFANPDEAAWDSIRSVYEIGIVQKEDEVVCLYRPKEKFSGDDRPVTALFEINLPEAITTSVRVSRGDLTVEGAVRAPLRVIGGSGNIVISEVAAPLSILTLEGATTIERISTVAELVEVHSWTGAVQLGLEQNGAYAVSISSATISNPRSAAEMMPIVRDRGETEWMRLRAVPSGGSILVEGLKLKVSERTASKLKGRTKVGGTRVVVSTGGGDARLVGLPEE